MTHLVISDVHGRNKWKPPATEFLQNEEGIVVFLGDYNDSWDVKDAPMVDNFIDILLLKESYPDRVKLLLGNHDFSYLGPHYGYWGCSGNRKDIWGALNILFRTHQDLFELAYQYKDTLFVHAGLSTGWLEYNRGLIERQLNTSIEKYLEFCTYAELLNDLFQSVERGLLAQVSSVHGGYDYYDGPIWVRPRQLEQMLPLGLKQVVGHTAMSEPVSEMFPDGSGVIYTDCMANKDWTPLRLEL